MIDLRACGQLAGKALSNPQKAAYRFKQWGATPVAAIHTSFRARKIPHQTEKLDRLRQDDEYLLIVLDACRYDVFRNVAPEYLRFRSVEPVLSAGRNTFEYVARCWPNTYDATYVSAATPVNSDPRDAYDPVVLKKRYDGYVPAEHLTVRDIWRESWDESIGITPPDPVTDAVLDTAPGRVVAHYFQPHAPYIGRQSLLGHTEDEDARPNEGEPVDAPIWSQIRYGETSRQEHRRAYVSNLRRALRSVRRLVAETTIENIVVMGDHGEALGEYGIHGHPAIDHPDIRTVPWAVVDGIQQTPGNERAAATNVSVESRLEDLGYL